jgi:ABC-type Na+ efflux pump permease subunit
MALIIWAVIPLMIAALIQLAFGGDESPLAARLLVVDLDDSFASRFLIGALGQGQLAELIIPEHVDAEEGRRRIDRGEATALLTIPEGFGRSVIEEQPVTLDLVTNPSQRILPALVEEVLATFVDGAFYLQRLFRSPIDRVRSTVDLGAAVVPDSMVSATSLAINATMNSLGPLILPPVIELETASEDDDGGLENLGALFLVGMLFMALIFVAQSLSEDIWREKQLGTLERAAVAPHHIAALLAGKVVAGTIVLMLLAAFGLVAGRYLFRLELANLALGTVWAGLFGLMAFVLFLHVQMSASEQRTAGIVASLFMFPLMLVGGSFFPLEVMPAGLARIGQLTPNGWALGHFKHILLGELDLTALFRAAGTLVTVTGVAFALATWRLRARFIHR